MFFSALELSLIISLGLFVYFVVLSVFVPARAGSDGFQIVFYGLGRRLQIQSASVSAISCDYQYKWNIKGCNFLY